MREGLIRVLDQIAMDRITPACAGRTSKLFQAWFLFRDHPRMCGKDSFTLLIALSIQGSPPHVREGLLIDNFFFLSTRITPACAGRTFVICYRFCLVKDHPRMCGKDQDPNPCVTLTPGSPPHVREELEGTKIPLNWLGITPARAGRTRLLDLLYKIVEDHPRSRGKD